MKHFGELAFIRGIYYYYLSPHEIKPMAQAITHGLPNIIPRTKSTILTWGPPLLTGAYAYIYLERWHKNSLRKHPGDFDHEVDPMANYVPPKKPCKPKEHPC